MSVFFVVIWLVMAALGAWVGGRKQRPVLGLALGLVLGLIGVLIIALVPPRQGTA
jgi:hypothetical protein